MKLLQIDIDEIKASAWFRDIKDEKELRVLIYTLECANLYLEYKQKGSNVQKKREHQATKLAADKRFNTRQAIIEYTLSNDSLTDAVHKFKIVNIAKHTRRTEQTIRNILIDYASVSNIAINGKLHKHTLEICYRLAGIRQNQYPSGGTS